MAKQLPGNVSPQKKIKVRARACLRCVCGVWVGGVCACVCVWVQSSYTKVLALGVQLMNSPGVWKEERPRG
jgi:hypothetical protein